jgi:hypothetical protein
MSCIGELFSASREVFSVIRFLDEHHANNWYVIVTEITNYKLYYVFTVNNINLIASTRIALAHMCRSAQAYWTVADFIRSVSGATEIREHLTLLMNTTCIGQIESPRKRAEITFEKAPLL